MPLTPALQSWGKCDDCKNVLWCEVSPHHQDVVCRCGGCECNDGEKNDGPWEESFSESAMQDVLDGVAPEIQP